MTPRNFLTIFAVLAALFGVGFVAAPNDVLALYGFPASPYLAVLGRLFGGTLLGLAVLQWLARDFHDETALTSLFMGLGVSHLVNFLVAVAGTVSGTLNALGWSTVLIYLAGAIGCGYFLRTRRDFLTGS